MKGARFGLALLGTAVTACTPAHAQRSIPPAAPFGQGSAADSLSWSLRSLSQNPRSLTALMGAGKAALKLGDAQAAITFFARAEEISPRDGSIKMWIGSALVQLEQPRAALKFFTEAVMLGASESEVARDRGLAYDISGDARRAQRDYELALRRTPDAEVTRRLALSLAISGERERALELLEEQLLVREPAAFRARAFVLALTGDVAGANRATEAAMPGRQAAAMAPFLSRLAALSPGDRALAVNFGHFPGDARPQLPQSFASLVSATDAGRPDPGQSAFGTPRRPVPEPVSTAPRRRPGTEEAPVQVASRSNSTAPSRRGPAPTSTAMVTEPVAAPSGTKPDPVPAGALELTAVTAQASLESSERSAVVSATPPIPEPASGVEATGGSRLAEVAAVVYSLPDNEPFRLAEAAPPSRPVSTVTARAVPPAVTSSTRPATKPAATPARKKEVAKPAEPSRHWVQVAGGANKLALPREFARLKAKATKLLSSRSAWTAPLNVTNRLLVGPFATQREAQGFVNELGKLDVSAFAWTSPAGQKVEKLPAK